jgi:hypothetical protein
LPRSARARFQLNGLTLVQQQRQLMIEGYDAVFVFELCERVVGIGKLHAHLAVNAGPNPTLNDGVVELSA